MDNAALRHIRSTDFDLATLEAVRELKAALVEVKEAQAAQGRPALTETQRTMVEHRLRRAFRRRNAAREALEVVLVAEYA